MSKRNGGEPSNPTYSGGGGGGGGYGADGSYGTLYGNPDGVQLVASKVDGPHSRIKSLREHAVLLWDYKPLQEGEGDKTWRVFDLSYRKGLRSHVEALNALEVAIASVKTNIEATATQFQETETSNTASANSVGKALS